MVPGIDPKVDYVFKRLFAASRIRPKKWEKRKKW